MKQSISRLNEASPDLSNIAQDYDLSETAYSCGYDLRLKYSSFLQDALNWVSENHSSLLSEDSTKVLSLGCGSGLFDLELIKLIQQYNTHWTFKGMDFSMTDLDQFRNKLSLQDKEIQSNVTLEYKKYDPSLDMGERFDLVTMVHFLHSFENVLPVIKNTIRHLSPGGKLLIVQQKKQGIAELKEKFSYVLSNQKFQSSDKIKALLQSDNIRFTSHTIDSFFDISILKEKSLDSLLLMSFCLCNDLSVLSSQEQETIRKTFLWTSRAGKDGRQVIDEQMEIIVCQA